MAINLGTRAIVKVEMVCKNDNPVGTSRKARSRLRIVTTLTFLQDSVCALLTGHSCCAIAWYFLREHMKKTAEKRCFRSNLRRTVSSITSFANHGNGYHRLTFKNTGTNTAVQGRTRKLFTHFFAPRHTDDNSHSLSRRSTERVEQDERTFDFFLDKVFAEPIKVIQST